jgi:hypothetical protein
MRKILLSLVLSITVGWPVSYAQLARQLPVNGKRGVTGDSQPMPRVIIGREVLMLAPGGLIFDTNNRTILHNSLPVGAAVLYQVNTTGQIQRIYILRPDEQTRLDQARK